VDRGGEELRFPGRVDYVRWDKTRNRPPFDDLFRIM